MKNNKISFNIKCEMNSRWVPHFLSMLKYMEELGNLGSSRIVGIYSDGDGDFRPKFFWSLELDCNKKPIKDKGGDRIYDAG